MRRALAVALAVVLLLMAAAAPAVAVAAAPKVDLVDIEDEVMCVDCGIPLNTAEGAQPDSERELIRSLIAQGLTKEQIKRELVAEYGPDVLALPETSGVGITAYAIPVVLGGLVVAALVLLVPRWRRRPAAGMIGAGDVAAAGVAGAGAAGGAGAAAGPAGGSSDAALSDADAARLDADLARYDG
jgi:cytochrome c-type biogenesis protein CcmH